MMGSSFTMTSNMIVGFKSSFTRFATRNAIFIFYTDAVFARLYVIVKGFRATATETADTTKTLISGTLLFLSSGLPTLSVKTAVFFLDCH